MTKDNQHDDDDDKLFNVRNFVGWRSIIIFSALQIFTNTVNRVQYEIFRNVGKLVLASILLEDADFKSCKETDIYSYFLNTKSIHSSEKHFFIWLGMQMNHNTPLPTFPNPCSTLNATFFYVTFKLNFVLILSPKYW
jgi:hypothetical protein